MEHEEIIQLLTRAITGCLKINLQMQDTADENFILFQPYCVVTDSITGRFEIFGWVERHYAHDNPPYSRIAQFQGIRSIVVLDDAFEPIEDWRTELRRYAPLKDEILPIN